MHKKSPLEVAAGLWAKVYLVFGNIINIFADYGGEFQNRVMAALCEVTRSRSRPSPSFSPFITGLVERANKEVIGLVRRLENDTHDKWAAHLPELAYMINTTVCATTNMTPYMLIYGYNPSTDLFNFDLDLPTIEQANATNKEFLVDLVERQHHIRKLANEYRKRSREMMTSQLQKRRKFHQFLPGDQVLIYISYVGVDEYFKTSEKRGYKGPLLVTKQVKGNEYTYDLYDLQAGAMLNRKISVQRLRPYYQYLSPSEYLHDVKTTQFQDDLDDTENSVGGKFVIKFPEITRSMPLFAESAVQTGDLASNLDSTAEVLDPSDIAFEPKVGENLDEILLARIKDLLIGEERQKNLCPDVTGYFSMDEIKDICDISPDFDLQAALMTIEYTFFRFKKRAGKTWIAANSGHQFPVFMHYMELHPNMIGIEVIYECSLENVEKTLVEGIYPDKHGYIWLTLTLSAREMKKKNVAAIKLKWINMIEMEYRIFRHKVGQGAVTKGLRKNHTDRCFVSPVYIEVVCYPSDVALAEINGTWLPILQARVHQQGVQVTTVGGSNYVVHNKTKINGAAKKILLASEAASLKDTDVASGNKAPHDVESTRRYDLRPRAGQS
jgi:hypothetical protein